MKFENYRLLNWKQSYMMSRKKELLTLMMIDTSWYKNSESTNPTLANKLRTTGSWKLIPNAKISFITNDKYSFTLASNWIGKFVDKPVLSNDKKNFIAKGIIK